MQECFTASGKQVDITKKKDIIINVYVDESGSITHRHYDNNPYFIIALIKVNNVKKLKRVFKRFISSHIEQLKALDHDDCMFCDDKFKEIKGYELSDTIIADFITYFTKAHYFEIYYLKIKNSALTDSFCDNTARAFNYVIKYAIEYFLKKEYWEKDVSYVLQLDERNEKTRSKFFLEDYLNTELYTTGIIKYPITITYFDSANNSLVQLADVFSNLFYKSLKNKNKFGHYIDELEKLGFLRIIYRFPYNQ